MATTSKIEVKDRNPILAVQGFLKQLLQDDDISAVFVPCHMPAGGVIMPTLVTDPEQLDKADPFTPSFPLNAARVAAKLTRGEVEKNLVAVLRPCEIRAFVELVKLNQGNMDNILLIGADCSGAFSNSDYPRFLGDKNPMEAGVEFLEKYGAGTGTGNSDLDIMPACLACEHPTAESADMMIGLFGVDTSKVMLIQSITPRGEGPLNKLSLSDVGEHEGRKKAVKELKAKREEYRNRMYDKTLESVSSLKKLGEYLAGCVNCYNCRVACPVCYCKECVFVTDVFDHKPWQYLGWAKKKGSLRLPVDTIFYHMTRLAHMSTLCVGCGQCSNACPNNVKVMELFRTVSAKTQRAFEYQAGRSTDEPPPLSIFHEKEFTEVTGGVVE